MTLARHAVRLVLREPRRSIAALVGIALASALITAVLLFGIASGASVTRRALADLPVDMQIVLAPGADPAAARAIVEADPAVRSVRPFDLAHFDSATLDSHGSATQTSSGVLVGIEADYSASTGLFVPASGAPAQPAPGSIFVSRDLASNLGAVPGDTIVLTLVGGATASLPISGLVTITGADLLLGPIDAAHRSAGANPPANVAVMRRSDLEQLVLAKIPADAIATDPGTGQAGSGQAGSGSPVHAPEPAVRREWHVEIDHAQLPGDPSAAQGWLDTVRRRLNRQAAGTFQAVDDASATLEPLAADLAWGQILFIFLALPGIALALALSRLAADATADTTRRHAALLRARGARPGQLRLVFVVAAVITALLGSALGALAGGVAGWALLHAELVPADAPLAVLRSGLSAIILATLLASFAAIVPLRSQLREEVAAGRQELRRVHAPLWQRLFLDLVALVVGTAAWFVAGGAIHPVLTAEGNPTVTLALTSFMGPLLLWLGGTLLLLRGLGLVLSRSDRLATGLGRILGPGGELAGRSIAARAGASSRVILVVALAVSFATSVVIFQATYRQQQLVDARLTLGADLQATPAQPAAADAAAQVVTAGAGVATPFVDRVVYVGPEAQDLLAIDPTTLPTVTALSDSFFQGTTAAAALEALRTRPDAILVSAETAKDYSIVPGDRLRVRIPDATGQLKAVDFHMAGIALEFPTAPKDAFLVANLTFVAQQTGNNRISFVLARAIGDPTEAGRTVAAHLGSDWQVRDLTTTNARLANSITSVDLTNLVVIDLGFAALIAAVGAGLFLLAGLAERRRELATLVAIGAEPSQVRTLIIGEALTIGVGGITIGVAAGVVVGLLLVQLLAGVFDPPPDLPAIPAVTVGVVAGGVGIALAIAALVAQAAVSRLGVVAALRER